MMELLAWTDMEGEDRIMTIPSDIIHISIDELKRRLGWVPMYADSSLGPVPPHYRFTESDLIGLLNKCKREKA